MNCENKPSISPPVATRTGFSLLGSWDFLLEEEKKLILCSSFQTKVKAFEENNLAGAAVVVVWHA